MENKAEVFNSKQNELKEFSKKIPSNTELPSVPQSGGLFGLFNYDVTGNDLNALTESIQDKMIEQNKVLVNTIKEFSTIYDTFEALDKEYIQGILVSVKAAEEANQKALKGLEGVQKNTDEITKDQADIKQLLDHNKQVLTVLKSFKDKIDKIEHITDIDQLYTEFYSMKEIIEKVSNNISEKITEQNVNITQFKDELSYKIDSEITIVQKSISTVQVDIDSVQTDLNDTKKEFKGQFEEINKLYQDQLNTLSTLLEKNESDYQIQIQEIKDEFNKKEAVNQVALNTLGKDIKVSKIVSSVSLVGVVTLLILILSGVV